jgi:hypothetical protein
VRAECHTARPGSEELRYKQRIILHAGLGGGRKGELCTLPAVQTLLTACLLDVKSFLYFRLNS